MHLTELNKIAINTLSGQTSRMDIDETVMQGSTWGSLLCSVQTDKIGKDALERKEYLYSYKIIKGKLTYHP